MDSHQGPGQFRDNEHFYDEHVAPMLLSLLKQCEARGMSFLALVEFAARVDRPDDAPQAIERVRGRTEFLAQGASLPQHMAHWAARSDGNVDSFMMAVMRWAKEHGHSSAILTLLDAKRHGS